MLAAFLLAAFFLRLAADAFGASTNVSPFAPPSSPLEGLVSVSPTLRIGRLASPLEGGLVFPSPSESGLVSPSPPEGGLVSPVEGLVSLSLSPTLRIGRLASPPEGSLVSPSPPEDGLVSPVEGLVSLSPPVDGFVSLPLAERLPLRDDDFTCCSNILFSASSLMQLVPASSWHF